MTTANTNAGKGELIRAVLLFPFQAGALGLFLYTVAGGHLLVSPAQILGLH